MKKETNLEERDKYRPLLCSKNDFKDFMLECEKCEKKETIELRREED